MKISLNWLKTLLPLQQSAEEIEAILTSSGLEVEHYEHIDSVKGGLRGLIVGEVKICEQHGNADKLKICKVDIGAGELLNIVCGAPNVAAGQKVIVATVGTILHPVKGDSFTIQKSKIRGEMSEGMLCAEDEIGLGESHAGLLILPETSKPGSAVADLFQVESDVVFEIGLTANRGDAASHIGVAREIAAILQLPFQIPTTTIGSGPGEKSIEIKIENKQNCPRYSGIIIQDIEVKESPEWLKNRLHAIGLRPINNIVDITNFVLHELGQPLHAFDYAKISGNKIEVKNAVKGDKFVTLDGVERTLNGDELMISNAENHMCIAGVFGGLNSGVDNHTKTIFLESAYFAPDIIRKASKQHNLSTDASFRFERGTDPEMCIPALKKAAAMIGELAGGKVVSEIYDVYPEKLLPFQVELRKSMLQKITGIDIPNKTIQQILTGLGIQIVAETEIGFNLLVPRVKSDVTREIDVIEELIRIYGFKHIPLQTNLRMSLNYKSGNNSRKAENKITEVLSANGFIEIMNNSLSSDKFYPEKDKLVYVSNPLSAELNVMRASMLYGALESVAYNKNRKQNSTRFFEFGRTYLKKENGFKEIEQLIIIVSGTETDESWEVKSKPVDVYSLKSIASKVLDVLNLKNEKLMFNEVDQSTLQLFGIKDKVFYTVLDWTKTFKQKSEFILQPIPQFPVVRRDLSLVLDRNIRYDQVKDIITRKGGKKVIGSNVFDVYEGKPLEAGQKALSISLDLYDEEKTMSDSDIDPVINHLIQTFETELNAVIRK